MDCFEKDGIPPYKKKLKKIKKTKKEQKL